MRIDVVMPTYNRASLIGPAIGSFAASTWDGAARLIVVDNNSGDGTRAAVEAAQAAHPAAAIHYLFEPQQGRAHALNRGIAEADGDVVAFYDDDERLAPDWLPVLAEEFADPAVGFLGGPVRPDWSAAAPGWVPKSGYGGVLSLVDNGPDRRRYGEPGFNAMLIGGNAAIRRDVLHAMGPFTQEFQWAEDREMFGRLLRAGAAGYYVPRLVVYHHVPPKRLTKDYFRHWAHAEGRTNGSALRTMEAAGPPPRSALGAPLWMWRQALGSAGRAAWGYARGRADDAGTFAAELDVRQFLGFYMQRNLPFIPRRPYDRA